MNSYVRGMVVLLVGLPISMGLFIWALACVDNEDHGGILLAWLSGMGMAWVIKMAFAPDG